MNPKSKRILAILASACLAMLLLVGLLAGCGARSYYDRAAPQGLYYEPETGMEYTREYIMEEADYDYGNLYVQNYMALNDEKAGGAVMYGIANTSSGWSTAGGAAEPGSFVITTADFTIQTKTYDAFSAALRADLKAMGGYTNSYDEWNYESGRHASVVARVPRQQLEAFLNNLRKNGTVVNESQRDSDVTDEMIETGSRKEALLNEEAALLAILEKAKNVEEIITVQDRLSWVRADLQSYSQKLQSLQNRVNYSTVNINVMEVNRITTPTQKFSALASSGFLGSLRDIGMGLRNFALWFIGAIPYLVMLAVPAVVLVWFIRRRRRNKKAKKAAMDA